jgi:hypothetical protein
LLRNALVLGVLALTSLGLFLLLGSTSREARPKRQLGDRTPKREDVDLASDQSFPASDPPAWTRSTSS